MSSFRNRVKLQCSTNGMETWTGGLINREFPLQWNEK